MSGTVLEYQGRAFWSKYLIDIWVYHLAYLVFQDAESEQWLIDWAKNIVFIAARLMPDFMLHPGDDFVTDEQIAVWIRLTQKLLERLNHYDDFLAQEKLFLDTEAQFPQPLQKLLTAADIPIKNLDNETINGNNSHWDIINRFTINKMAKLKTFGYLLVKLYTGENWYPAYFDSCAEPHWVKLIDYLERVKPDGELGVRLTQPARRNSNICCLVRANNSGCKIEWRNSCPYCDGIPDLVIMFQNLEEDVEFDEQELDTAIQENYREQWFLDLEKRIVLQISTAGVGFASRYPTEVDFYSPVLDKYVNLAYIFDVEQIPSIS